jgi:hypothetical protein
MNKMIRNSCLALLAVFATATLAHHSAVQFDFAKQVSYTGTVKDFAAINPHMRLLVEWKDDKGKMHSVRFEGHSTNNMYRAGYRKGMVKVGDTITVNAAPFRDGTEGGYVISAKLADGQFFGMQSRAQRDVQAAGEEARKAAEGR